MQVTLHAAVGTTPEVLVTHPALYVAEIGALRVFDYAGRSVRQLLEAYLGPDSHPVAVDRGTHDICVALNCVNGHPELYDMLES